MRKLKSRFTMKCVRHLFNDKISGLGVYEYEDKYGDKYLANYPFYPWSFRTFKSE
jgi:hypothetical protein